MDLASIPKQMAYVRIGYAVAAFFTPKLATAAIGGRPSQVTPAAMGWAGVFASREAAMGALTLGSEDLDPATRRKVLLLNAAIDAVDVVAIVALAKRQRSILPLLLAVPVGVLSVVAHVQAARPLAGAPSAPGGGTPENVYVTA
jgi:hypothetical protein